MNKLFLGLTVGLIVTFSGCSCMGARGNGESFGIVATVEEDRPALGRDSWSLWFKTDPTDSAPDCYVIKDNDQKLIQQMREFAKEKTYTKITFTRYGPWSHLSKCSDSFVFAIEEAHLP